MGREKPSDGSFLTCCSVIIKDFGGEEPVETMINKRQRDERVNDQIATQRDEDVVRKRLESARGGRFNPDVLVLLDFGGHLCIDDWEWTSSQIKRII